MEYLIAGLVVAAVLTVVVLVRRRPGGDETFVDFSFSGPPPVPADEGPYAADESARDESGPRYPFVGCEAGSAAKKYGFIDRQGRIAVEPIYWSLNAFCEGRALARDVDDVFIDSGGRVLFTLDLAKVHDSDVYSEGVMVVSLLGGRFGIVDRDGCIVKAGIEAADRPGQFSHGRAVYQVRSKAKDGLWGYLGLDGSVAIEPQFVEARSFSEGLAAAARQGEKGQPEWGFIDPDGAWVIEPRFSEVQDFSEGLALVPKTGFVGPDGKLVIAFEETHNWARGSFHDGRASFRTGPKAHGFVDRQGQVVIEPKYHEVSDFSEGRATVKLDWSVSGLIDLEGSWVIEPGRFSRIDPFRDGLAAVEYVWDSNIPKLPEEGHSKGSARWHAYIDRQGEEVFRWFVWHPPGLPI